MANNIHKRFANKFDEANNNFRVLINGKNSETLIKRSDQWAICTTEKKYNEIDCKVPGGKKNFEPSKVRIDSTLFIYCSDKLGIIAK